jgi:hypothetical protein
MKEAAGSSETLVDVNQTTWHHTSEDSNFMVTADRSQISSGKITVLYSVLPSSGLQTRGQGTKRL